MNTFDAALSTVKSFCLFPPLLRRIEEGSEHLFTAIRFIFMLVSRSSFSLQLFFSLLKKATLLKYTVSSEPKTLNRMLSWRRTQGPYRLIFNFFSHYKAHNQPCSLPTSVQHFMSTCILEFEKGSTVGTYVYLLSFALCI